MSINSRVSRNRVIRTFLLAGAAIGALAVFAGGATAQAPRLLSPPLAADGTLSFADLVERVSPAVVSILVEREVRGPAMPGDIEQFFHYRFGDPNGDEGPFSEEPQTMQAQGSGFFIDGAGHIVTNNHVIEDADAIEVRLPSGDTLKATLIGSDPLTDIAVLKVEPKKGQPYVQFSDDVNLRVGDWVVAVGNPFGLSGTVTAGIVSAIGGQGRDSQYLDFIQIDAPINRGNSGGPTFDLKGRVVGVNTAIYSTTGGSVGIGFAIPAKIAKETVRQLIESGSVTRGWLGVSIQDVTTEIAAALGRKEARGALIAEVIDETPAAEAGFESGDLVVSLDGKKIDNARDLTRSVAALPPGQKAEVDILRDGKPKKILVTLGERSEDSGQPSEAPHATEDSLSADLGLRVSELNPALRQQFRVPDEVEGVLVTGVKSGGKAEAAGLRTGAVILQVDGKPAISAAALKRAIDDAKKAGKEGVLVRYQIGSAKQFGALTLSSE
jgi:serine protease Do